MARPFESYDEKKAKYDTAAAKIQAWLDREFVRGTTVEYEQYDREGNICGLKRYGLKMPSLIKAARMLGVNRGSLQKWSVDTAEDGALISPALAEAYERVKLMEAEYLEDNGLFGTYSADVTKLYLKNNHGFTDKTEQEHSGGVSVFNDWLKTLE